jgi:membrane associated rhomboid family serine protease
MDKDQSDKLQQMMDELKRSKREFNTASSDPAPLSTPKKNDKKGSWQNRLMLPIAILAIPWTQEIIDQLFFQGRWNFVVYPRMVEGIPGIFLSAFSHAGFSHLIANSIGFLIFSWLILLKSERDFWITFLIGWIGGGLANWLLAPQSVHGLSGVVYTLFGYLLVIGWLEKRFLPLLISVFVFINYSSVIWGIFPSQPLVAWWGHLLGLFLGFFAAYGVYRETK